MFKKSLFILSFFIVNLYSCSNVQNSVCGAIFKDNPTLKMTEIKSKTFRNLCLLNKSKKYKFLYRGKCIFNRKNTNLPSLINR